MSLKLKTYIFSILGLLILYFSMHLFTVSTDQQWYGNSHKHSKIVSHHNIFHGLILYILLTVRYSVWAWELSSMKIWLYAKWIAEWCVWRQRITWQMCTKWGPPSDSEKIQCVSYSTETMHRGILFPFPPNSSHWHRYHIVQVNELASGLLRLKLHMCIYIFTWLLHGFYLIWQPHLHFW